MPFVQIDDFVNQSEDAVTLGYRVLEATVNEIKRGYAEALEFNRKQEAFEKGEGPAPPVPWEQIVDRAQRFQNIALDAVRDGTDIMLDSIRSSTKSTKSVARAWQQSRDDVGANPVLAGPVFDAPIDVEGRPGQRPRPFTAEIHHRGLARLRINAVVDPQPLEVPPPVDRDAAVFNSAISATFEPITGPEPDEPDPEVSRLTITFGAIPSRQRPGVYDGLIRASNFELLIARLRIRVLAATADRPETRAAAARNQRSARSQRGQQRRA
jgi:hypothetical protein